MNILENLSYLLSYPQVWQFLNYIVKVSILVQLVTDRLVDIYCSEDFFNNDFEILVYWLI